MPIKAVKIQASKIQISKNTYFLLTECESHTREYWPEIVTVLTQKTQGQNS